MKLQIPNIRIDPEWPGGDYAHVDLVKTATQVNGGITDILRLELVGHDCQLLGMVEISFDSKTESFKIDIAKAHGTAQSIAVKPKK